MIVKSAIVCLIMPGVIGSPIGPFTIAGTFFVRRDTRSYITFMVGVALKNLYVIAGIIIKLIKMCLLVR
jgi:hypothetical protein